MLNLLAAKCERRDGNVPAAIARLETIDRVSAPGRSAINIGYELGRLYDQQDDYVSAFSYFMEANKSSQHYPPHAVVDKNQFLDMVAALDAALSKDWIDGWRETPKLSGRQAPVFSSVFRDPVRRWSNRFWPAIPTSRRLMNCRLSTRCLACCQAFPNPTRMPWRA